MKSLSKSLFLILMLVVIGLVVALAAGAFAAEGGKVNINTATIDDLVQLDQVGTRTAQRIIEYREANGPFKAPEDLMKVKGIGEKIFQKNKDRISV